MDTLPDIYFCTWKRLQCSVQRNQKRTTLDSIYIFWSNFHLLATEGFFFLIEQLEFMPAGTQNSFQIDFKEGFSEQEELLATAQHHVNIPPAPLTIS